jgi:LysM repeat protein
VVARALLQAITGSSEQGVAEGLTEMDKSEPSAGRDTGPRSGPEKIAKPITKEKMVNHALDTLSKSMAKKDDKKKDVKESDTLMIKLKRAMVREGRVKELADDLKTMSDADFMKKYGKAKAAIRKDMKRVDEARTDYTPDEMADMLSGKRSQKQIDADAERTRGPNKAAPTKESTQYRANRLNEKLTTSDTLSRPAASAPSPGKAIDDPDIMGSLRSGPKFDRLGKTGGEPEFDFRSGLVGGETEVEAEPRLMVDPLPDMQKWGGKFATGSAGGDNRFTAPTGWRYVEKGEDPARYGSGPAAATSALPNLIYDPQSRTLKSADAPALDMTAKSKFKFDRATQSQVPADGSGANPNIDDATRDRARAWAAQQNAPGAALAGAMRSSGTPVATAKNKTDWKTIYNLNKAIIGSDPNRIRPGMKLKMPNGSTYSVQSGDTLSKIAAGQINELSTEKLAQYKTAAARDARAADQEGDFKRGDKRFSGIVKATKKQFDNDAKQVDENYQSLTEANYLGWLMKLKDMILKIFKSKVKPTVPSSADARFQQMMGKITEPIDPSRLQNLYQEYKSNPQYYLPTPTPRDSPETLRYWTASLADFVMNKFPNADHDVLGDLGGNLATLAVKESLRAVKENVSKVSESRAARRALMARIVNSK